MDVDKLIEIAMDCYAAGYQDGDQDGAREEATGLAPSAGWLKSREEKQRRRAKSAFVRLMAGVSDG